MAESIFDILNDVKEVDTTDPNSRVLIIDGLNLFLRNFSVNGMLNDNGIPIGGVMGFLKSLALSIREVNPTRIVIAFDGKGGSTRRRKILPSYKNNRKPGKRMTRWDAWKNYEEEHDSQKSQIKRLIQYLSTLPINVIQIDNIEADDTIAYITNNLLEKEVTIMSADQDFLQLVNERVTVWSPIKKKFYTPDLVMKDYGVPAHNFLMYKVLMGDKSDNIEGIKGLGPKKLPKIKIFLLCLKKKLISNLNNTFSNKNVSETILLFLTRMFCIVFSKTVLFCSVFSFLVRPNINR